MRSSKRSDAVRRTSDAEITRPLNELPAEPPLLPSWHVHLELQPEELITLHRLGFTGSALAWREGMPEWQPLRVGEPGIRDARDSTRPPAKEESLPEPIPLTRRARSSSASGASLQRPKPFSSGRHSTPPIAMAVAHKSERPRPELMLPPPPPPIEARAASPEPAPAGRALTLVEPWHKLDQSPSPVSGVREQQPPSIPPLALEARPRTQRRVGSRAMWLGAAALVALSASNGALVSALLWSLRQADARPAASAARAASVPPSTPSSAAAGAECPAPSAGPTNLVSLGFGSGRSGPVSVDELPLAGTGKATERSSSASSERTARSLLAATGATASRTASGRKNAGRGMSTEEAAQARRAEAPATTGPLDRGALAQAVGRAAGAASSCAPSPEKGRVALTFSPAGSVQAARLEQSFGDPGINSCVLRAMGRARVRPFIGEPVTVHKTLRW